MCQSTDLVHDTTQNVPLAGRALKRHLQRERRRFYRAATKEAAMADTVRHGTATTPSSSASDAETLTVSVPQCPETKVLVRNTFLELPCYDTSDSDSDDMRVVGELPDALFGTSDEFDEFRRAYRRFRLGFHQGAKGEAPSPKTSCDWLTLSPLDKTYSASSSEDDTRCTSSSSDSRSSSKTLSARGSDVEEPMAEKTAQQAARAMKRQRQRERRRFFKAQDKAEVGVHDNALSNDYSHVLCFHGPLLPTGSDAYC